ncbi:GNAT family N-acetyltransferase [Altererythrobacter sp.]|uniref:GNAT family N-acetyltransferase n=1 Tax=Altererythrobacter sp. TaxID=1872480 RepID=UPI003D05C46F
MATRVEIGVELRDMVEPDLPAAIELSQEYSWPHRQEDWELFCELGEGIVAVRDCKVVGTILAWRMAENYAMVGMVLVATKMQGHGIGHQLMDAMLDRLKGRNIILNATPESMPFYSKLGFVPTGVVRQHQGTAPAVPLSELNLGERLRPMGNADVALPAMYSTAMSMDRTKVFNAMSRDAKTVVLSRDHEPAGFAMLRRFGRGGFIGPIVAPDIDGAKLLVSHCFGTRVGRFCRVDAVEGLGLSRWLEALGLPCVATVTTMVKGTPPPVAEGPRVFALATQAFG